MPKTHWPDYAENAPGRLACLCRKRNGLITPEGDTCAYDRAGYGFSDASGRASDARNAVDDLHRLLRAAAIHVPIVYVGHSVAGVYGALHEASHPEDIAGAVLVDPVFVQDWKSTVDSLSPEARSTYLKEVAQWSESTHACLDLARSGALTSPSTKQAKDCVDADSYPDRVDQVLRSELARRSADPKILNAMASEVDSRLPGMALGRPELGLESVNDVQLKKASLTFGDKPLIVLTSDEWYDADSRLAPAQQARAFAVGVAGEGALAGTSRRGSQIVVPHSGHFIQVDQPGAVVDAVKRVVQEIRQPDRTDRDAGTTPKSQ